MVGPGRASTSGSTSRSTPTRIGTKSFDLRYQASVEGRPACEAVITYVAIRPGSHDSVELPAGVRETLAGRMA